MKKSLLAIILSMVLVLSCMPVGVYGAVTYREIDYSTRLVHGDDLSLTLTKDTPYLTLEEENNFSGYSLGATVAMRSAYKYSITIRAEVTGEYREFTEYMDGGIFLLSSLTGEFQECKLRGMKQSYSGSSVVFDFDYFPEADGDTYFLMMFNAIDTDGNQIFAPYCNITFSLREWNPYVYETHTYMVTKPSDLEALPKQVEQWGNPSNVTLSLKDHLDFSRVDYTPVSLPNTRVEFLGNGFTMSGLTTPLFDVVGGLDLSAATLSYDRRLQGSGVLENQGGLINQSNGSVYLSECTVNATLTLSGYDTLKNIGAVVGLTNGMSFGNASTCRLTVLLQNVGNAEMVGGFAGQSRYQSYLKESVVQVTVKAQNVGQVQYLGGVLGYSDGEVTADRLWLTGEVNGGDNSTAVGGICGYANRYYSNGTHEFKTTTVVATVTGGQGVAGFGAELDHATFTECQLIGTVTAKSQGALFCGGIPQRNGNITLTDCYKNKTATLPEFSCQGSGVAVKKEYTLASTSLGINQEAVLQPKATDHITNHDRLGTGYSRFYTLSLEQGKEYVFHYYWGSVKGISNEVRVLLWDKQGNLMTDFGGSFAQSVNAMNWEDGDPFTVTQPLSVDTTDTYFLQVITLFNQNDWKASSLEDAYFGAETKAAFKVMELPSAPTVIRVGTVKELQGLQKKVNGLSQYLWVRVELTKDIAMNGAAYTTLKPDLTKDKLLYRLEVVGNSHKITGLTGPLVSTVKELTVTDCELNLSVEDVPYDLGYSFFNGGKFGGFAVECATARLTNCRVSGTVKFNSKFIVEKVGGLVGEVTQSLIAKNCHVVMDFTLDGNDVNSIGGAVGFVGGYGVSVFEKVTYRGTMMVPRAIYWVSGFGGIVGSANQGVVFKNCKADLGVQGIVGTSFSFAGGILGRSSRGGVYAQTCSAKVNFSVGKTAVYGAGNLGGFVGGCANGYFENCTAKGSIWGNDNLGGFIGRGEQQLSFVNCYTTVDLTGQTYLGGFAGICEDGGEFENCYAAGNITLSAYPYNPIVGTFIGGVETGFYHTKFGATNCFAKQKEGLPSIGSNILANGKIPGVNFTEEAQVVAMETALNQVVEGHYRDLLSYEVRNEKNAPAFGTKEIVYGDVNFDGNIDAKDALLILKHAVDKITLTPEQALVAQVDGEEGINAKDALDILKYSVNKLYWFAVEKA